MGRGGGSLGEPPPLPPIYQEHHVIPNDSEESPRLSRKSTIMGIRKE